MKKDELKFSQIKAAHLIVSGMNLKDVAAAVGVNETTLFRWLRSAAMQETIRELRRIVIESSTNDLLRLNKLALQTLERLMTCGNFSSECRAAAYVLDKTHLSVEFWDYDERLRRIEERFDENK